MMNTQMRAATALGSTRGGSQTRPGFYVESRHYPLTNRNQAIARANHLAREYGRDVRVTLQNHHGRRTTDYAAQAVVDCTCEVEAP